MAQSTAEVLKNWVDGMKNSTAKVKAGVMAMTENPLAKAAAKQDSYLAGVQEAVSSGRYRDGLLSVPFTEWQTLTAEKGSARISAGVEAARPKMEKFFAQLLPFTAQVSKTIQAMPSGTTQASKDRMNANFEAMSQFRFRKRS